MSTSADVPDALTLAAFRAVGGEGEALEFLCKELQGPIYALALRMFFRPVDAADATQEALIAIVTNLASFEGRSKLLTWAYTVASRHFLRMKRRAVEETVVDADTFANWLDLNRSTPAPDSVGSLEFDELCAEVRIGCTYGMLLCLGRNERVAYLLGDVIGFTDKEGAAACEISPAAFRQRLARARKTMRSLMADRCGLVRSENPCRCSSLVAASLSQGIVDRTNLVHTHHQRSGSISSDTIEGAARELDVAVAISEVFRSDPKWVTPQVVWRNVEAALPTLTGKEVN
jgi:RNA polymerase sigma factor (sigma-70 family)